MVCVLNSSVEEVGAVRCRLRLGGFGVLRGDCPLAAKSSRACLFGQLRHHQPCGTATGAKKALFLV